MKRLPVSANEVEILKIALEEGFGIGDCKEYAEGCPDCEATQIYRRLGQLES